MEQRLSLITLGVEDIARARAFYEALGWKASSVGATATGEAAVCFFQLGGIVLALWDRRALAKDVRAADHVTRFRGVALAYNARGRAEVDAVLGEAQRAGGRIVKPAQDTFYGGYAGYFADPDGHLWEIAWNPDFRIDTKGNVTLPG
jgi:predicted lactoylglutathione lyase